MIYDEYETRRAVTCRMMTLRNLKILESQHYPNHYFVQVDMFSASYVATVPVMAFWMVMTLLWLTEDTTLLVVSTE